MLNAIVGRKALAERSFGGLRIVRADLKVEGINCKRATARPANRNCIHGGVAQRLRIRKFP